MLGACQEEKKKTDTGQDVKQHQITTYLAADIVKRRLARNRKANQEHVRLRVRERTQAVIVFLAGGIPEAQVDGLSVNHDVGRVIVKDSGNVLAGKGIGRVADQETRLTDGTGYGEV